MQREPSLRIVLFGGTGLAGSGVLHASIAAPEVASIVAVTRRPLGVAHPKLREIIHTDFTDLSPIRSSLEGVDACFYCLGISVSKTTEEEYRTITNTYAIEAARRLKEASPGHTFHFLSGAGTRLDSGMMWARVKAETEEELKGMGLVGILCWRPGMILGDRVPGGLSWRYHLLLPLLRLARFIPSLSVSAEMIGQAMIEATLEGRREGTVPNREIREIAERYQTRGKR